MLKGIFKKKKADGVINAAHFDSEGRLLWVRAYERRGPTWSDHVLLDRQTLIHRLKAGKRFFVGKRIVFQASEFELQTPVRLVNTRKGPVLVSGSLSNQQTDSLADLPIV
jgi:hypothetical protein